MRLVRKALFALSLIAIGFFGPACFKIALRQSVSLFAKISLGGQFSSEDVSFREGGLSFLGVSFSQMDAKKALCEIKALELFLSFSWDSSLRKIKALASLKEPEIVIDVPISKLFSAKFLEKQRALTNGAGWIDWQWEVLGASLNSPELSPQVIFSAKKAAARDVFSLEFVSGSSRAELSAFKENGERRASILFSNWDLTLLQPCFGGLLQNKRFEQGRFDGQIACKELSSGEFHLSLHGDLNSASLLAPWGKLFIAKSSVEMEADLHLSKESPFSLNWGRLCYSGGEWQKGRCKMRQLEGSLSYCFDLGLQWQSAGEARLGQELYPISLSAKGFWPTSESAWLDLTFSSLEGSCLVHSDFQSWRIQADEIRPFWGIFLQDFLDRKSQIHDWDWTQGKISCLLDLKEEGLSEVTFHEFRGEGIKLCRKIGDLSQWSCDAVSMHFGADCEPGYFSLEGLNGSLELGGSYQMIVANWNGKGLLGAKEIGDSEWSGQIRVQRPAFEQMLSIEAGFKIVKKEPQHWILQGSAADYPFEVEVVSQETGWSAFFEGGSFPVAFGAELQKFEGQLLLETDSWKLQNTYADFVFRENAFRFEAFRLEKERGELFLDLRLTHGFWDVARVVASLKEGQLAIDPAKTEVLGSLLETQSISFQLGETFSCHLDIPWQSIFLWEAFDLSIPPPIHSEVSGSIALDFLYEKGQVCKGTLKTDKTPWDEREASYVLQIEKCLDRWAVSLQKDAPEKLSLQFFAGYDKKMWLIQDGDMRIQGESSLSCQFQGQSSSRGEVQLSLNGCDYKGRLKEFPIDISMQGNGCAALDLASLDYEVDFDCSQAVLKTETLELQNHKPLHALFSSTKGVMLQGIDCQFRLNGELVADCEAKIFHYRPLPGSWLLHEARLHLSEQAFSLLGNQWERLNPHQDIDVTADFRGSSDLSIFSCSIKEGLIPFGGVLRHVQNFEFYLDEKEIAVDFFCVHQSRDLRCKISADRKDSMKGSLILEDPDFLLPEGENPLQINWQYQPLLGLTIHCIQGSFPGIDAAFYLQAEDEKSHLIGSARLDFKKLSPFMPPLIAEFFTELDMGKGYELKGNLHFDRKDISDVFFTGLLSGKELELCGYVFRTLLAGVDIEPKEINISNLKISDPSGFFKMDTMVMRGEGSEPWTFSIPLLSFSEFRPSLLRDVGEDEGSISPLVIRGMHFREIQGVLEDKNTYTAEGELYFINSYKRQHTLLDVPSDVLGRIIGLDLELLVPVRGALRYYLKEGKFEITALDESYSEGDRSQFFLANNKMPATLDLDGNLHIQVKMKQYVLFKLTEAFTIFVHGKLKHPQYHLQKKK